MSSFFSLANRSTVLDSTQQNQPAPDNNNHNLLQDLYPLYPTTESYKTTFELWQPQTHHQSIYPELIGLAGSSRSTRGINMSLSDDFSNPSGLMMMRSINGGISCQDCGNQAKKDCPHMRCRTCCKSRGFECQTHVKSTWVPSAKRRERQQQLACLQRRHQDDDDDDDDENPPELGLQTQNSKRMRVNMSGTAPTGLESGNFPGEVKLEAVFRCVRVRSIVENEDQYAYQTKVNIGGHMFKGILHDHGPDKRHRAADSSSCGGSAPSGIQQLNLGTVTSTPRSSAAITSPSITAFLDPINYNSLYSSSAPLHSCQTGTQFFPSSRS